MIENNNPQDETPIKIGYKYKNFSRLLYFSVLVALVITLCFIIANLLDKHIPNNSIGFPQENYGIEEKHEYILYQSTITGSSYPAYKVSFNSQSKSSVSMEEKYRTKITVEDIDFSLEIFTTPEQGPFWGQHTTELETTILAPQFLGSLIRVKNESNYMPYHYSNGYDAVSKGGCESYVEFGTGIQACDTGSITLPQGGILNIGCSPKTIESVSLCDDIVQSLKAEKLNIEYKLADIPINYYSGDEKPFVIVNVLTPEPSTIIEEYEGVIQKLLLPDGSILSFTISHASPKLQLHQNELSKVETDNYKDIFRFEYKDETIYANIKTVGNCGESFGSIVPAPCGEPVFYGVIVKCENPNNDYTLCDAAVKTISGIPIVN